MEALSFKLTVRPTENGVFSLIVVFETHFFAKSLLRTYFADVSVPYTFIQRTRALGIGWGENIPEAH